MALHTISVDIETTGLDPETCQVLEIGLVYANLSLPTLNTSQQLRIVISTDFIKGDPYAICLNYELLKEIRDYPKSSKSNTLYLKPEQVMTYINNWVNNIEEIKGVDKVSIAGKNFAGFDGPFLANIGVKFNKRFSHKILDPGPMYITPEDDLVPSLQECLKRAYITSEVKHTAIEDAIDVLKVIHYKLHSNYTYNIST